ncbi:ROP1L protein, partial [Machaerirhynchus nigripectus]|nr:ROP1L protein [Machaerirhynchus nigripectus]
ISCWNSLQSLLSSMKQACEILTRDPEGGAARIPFETFSFLYLYLASIDGEISETETKAFLQDVQEQADKHSGMVLIRHF